jgi:hypothetical protein
VGDCALVHNKGWVDTGSATHQTLAEMVGNHEVSHHTLYEQVPEIGIDRLQREITVRMELLTEVLHH